MPITKKKAAPEFRSEDEERKFWAGHDSTEYIDWRAEHPSDDLMTDLLQAEFEDETGTRRTLTRAEVLGYVNLLAGAGNETTTRLIGWTGKVLADYPDQRKELVEDRSLLKNAIDEVLRYESPSPVQSRWITQNVEHYGQVVPKDNVMVLLTSSANRDERKFPDPDRFDIRRSIDHHLAFGYGIHFCLGAPLARLEGQIAIGTLLRRLPTLRLAVPQEKLRWRRGLVLRGLEALPVAFASASGSPE
jgi:cytochrome P450